MPYGNDEKEKAKGKMKNKRPWMNESMNGMGMSEKGQLTKKGKDGYGGKKKDKYEEYKIKKRIKKEIKRIEDATTEEELRAAHRDNIH